MTLAECPVMCEEIGIEGFEGRIYLNHFPERLIGGIAIMPRNPF
jgi:hypothetical protein